jgi:hypothetical protein
VPPVLLSLTGPTDDTIKTYKEPPKTLPRSPGNEREWLDACLGKKVLPGANFEFSGSVA